MSSTISRTISDAGIDAVEARTREALAACGFGVLTEIDGEATMKRKPGIDMPGYRTLGAFNPGIAHQAIGLEPRIGAMLPCNAILREGADGIEVSAVDPAASMQAVENAGLKAIAAQVRDMLIKAVEAS